MEVPDLSTKRKVQLAIISAFGLFLLSIVVISAMDGGNGETDRPQVIDPDNNTSINGTTNNTTIYIAEMGEKKLEMQYQTQWFRERDSQINVEAYGISESSGLKVKAVSNNITGNDYKSSEFYNLSNGQNNVSVGEIADYGQRTRFYFKGVRETGSDPLPKIARIEY